MWESPPNPAEDWVLPEYLHERALGAGVTGRVVMARHIQTGTPVAIKYLIKSSAAAPAFAGAFANEARVLSTLRSPHVTRLYEYVEGPAGSAIVMELVEGATLRAVLRAEGATGPEVALAVLKGSLLGLAAAHEAGVVHRDYKPDNVLVTPDGTSKLVDFGLATRFGATPAAAGTPVYMAPERFNSGPASAASDVYAATATFFECITGTRPYSGTTTLELMVQHTEAPIPDESAPEPLRPLIRAGLAKAPEDRPSSAAEFVAQLDEIARDAYGADWEERGQRRLATVVSALPLLLLLRGEQAPPAEAATDFAVTNLGSGPTGRTAARKARGPVAATVGILVVALLIWLTAKPGPPVAAGATVQAATTVTPDGSAPTSTPSAAVAAVVATPGATGTAAAAASRRRRGPSTSQPGSGAPATSGSTSPSTTPATQGSTASAPPPVLTVDSVQITAFNCEGTEAYATAEVTSDGKASGTLTFTWFSSPSASGAHTAYGAPTAVTLDEGQTDVQVREMQNFSGAPPAYWGVEVTTDPAAGSGNGSSETLLGPECRDSMNEHGQDAESGDARTVAIVPDAGEQPTVPAVSADLLATMKVETPTEPVFTQVLTDQEVPGTLLLTTPAVASQDSRISGTLCPWSLHHRSTGASAPAFPLPERDRACQGSIRRRRPGRSSRSESRVELCAAGSCRWPCSSVSSLLLWQRVGSPLSVSGVAASAATPSIGCDSIETVTATVRTNGSAGTIVYRWVRNGTASGELRQTVGDGTKQTDVVLRSGVLRARQYARPGDDRRGESGHSFCGRFVRLQLSLNPRSSTTISCVAR